MIIAPRGITAADVYINVGNATLTHVTMHRNRAATGGGGLYNLGTVTLRNSIISGSYQQRPHVRVADCIIVQSRHDQPERE